MFTGIVERLGTVLSIDPAAPESGDVVSSGGPGGSGGSGGGVSIRIDPGDWRYAPSPGDSISISGCCLTVCDPKSADRGWRFDVIPQTLAMTTLGALRAGDRVNLEHAATPTTLLGGHLVQGHVDGVAMVERILTEGEWRVRLAPPASLMPLINPQGSITVDGVSLTVAAVGAGATESWFEVALIPTTLERTTLGALAVGDRVNIETDALVRAVERLLEARGLIGRRDGL